MAQINYILLIYSFNFALYEEMLNNVTITRRESGVKT